MSLPTTEDFLRKLEANPAEAAAFDAATRRERPHCKNRREAAAHLLAAIQAKQAVLAASNEKQRQALRAARELEKAAAAMQATRAAERERARRSVSPAPVAKPAAPRPAPRPAASKPTPAPAPESHLSKFNRLTGPEASAYYREHRAAILAEQAQVTNAAILQANR